MRETLGELYMRRLRFTGVFQRFGVKNGWRGPMKTVLLSDVRDSHGHLVTDHLWFNYTRGFEGLGELNLGDLVSFYARVTKYVKGYVCERDGIDGREIDYRLSNPTRIKLLSRRPMQAVLEN